MKIKTLQDYLDLIPAQHQKPLFIQSVAIAVQPWLSLQEEAVRMVENFTIDTAKGWMLNSVGERIGIGRDVAIPIEDTYFTWNKSVSTGWNVAYWKGEFSPTSTISYLGDEEYRTLLRAKILANNWDGTSQAAYEAYKILFGENRGVYPKDNHDMTMDILVTGQILTAIEKGMLVSGKLSLRPAGVDVKYYFINDGDAKIFAFDLDNDIYGGFDVGQFIQAYRPT